MVSSMPRPFSVFGLKAKRGDRWPRTGLREASSLHQRIFAQIEIEPLQLGQNRPYDFEIAAVVATNN